MTTRAIINPLQRLKQWWQRSTPPVTANLIDAWHIGPRFYYAEPDLPETVRFCEVAMTYYRLLRCIDWELFPERDFTRTYPQEPVSYATFAAACLVKINEDLTHMTNLRTYLFKHPRLIWLLGFRLVPSNAFPWGFDANASLPTARHFTAMLRQMPRDCFTFLLDESVWLLQDEMTALGVDFGQQISLDTKHILAWVQENNPKAYVTDRFNKTKQPKGDPDCKLGCKRRHNQSVDADNARAESNTPPTPNRNPQPAHAVAHADYYWGYGTGVVATKVMGWGEFVLAEYTQPFNRPDVSYFYPLMAETTRRLGHKPLYGAYDAAFDAHYIYDYFHRPGKSWQEGFAAVPFTQRNKFRRAFNEDGHPLCEAGLVMTLKFTFTCRTTLYEHEREHYSCPLQDQPDTPCPVNATRWHKGGCTTRLPVGAGSRLRHQIDRDATLYKALYDQRSATERINAQAVALGIERPHLRNQQSITNHNTLIYTIINLRAWQRIQAKKALTETDNAD